jgi:hypothetical protein
VLKQDLLQAAALSTQQQLIMTAAADVGCTVLRTPFGKGVGAEWGYEDVINRSCVDDFFSSGLDQIRRRIAAAVPGLSAAWGSKPRVCYEGETARSAASAGAGFARNSIGGYQPLFERQHHQYTTLEETLAMIKQQRARNGSSVA